MRELAEELSTVALAPPPTIQRTLDSLASVADNCAVADRELVEGARKILRARVKMVELMPKELYRDQAWDMLLELFVSGEEGGIRYVKQLMITSAKSSTAAMRLIDRLEETNFVRRESDHLDNRRVIVSLTEHGRSVMIIMLREIFDPELKPTGAPVSFRP
jgi:DNA-binding MarR family transcriptional regulator